MKVRHTSKKAAQTLCVLGISALMILQPLGTAITEAATTVKETFKASAGVTYKDIRMNSSEKNQAIRTMEVNLNDPFTTIEVGIPNPLNHLARVTTQASQNTYEQHQVVGAINGSFFNGDLLPMYLIAHNNRLVNAGIIASGEDQYVNEPLAFGITQDKKGLISHYNLALSFSTNGVSYPITSTNKQRSNDSLILYTPEFPGGYTKTNPYGMEVVVTGLDKPMTLEFGSTVTGKITAIRPYGDKTNIKIPADGFVLSAHGDKLAAIKNLTIGDEISLSTNIDAKWQQADFMLAGGPLLVSNGKVSLSMDPNSSRARERAPRTAVAIDKTGNKVFLVTVDGRQAGYSNGMSLTEFAQYLVSIGVDDALNLDGGGSTAMATRIPGDFLASLVNRPSDGTERAISTTLMAVSTAPVGKASEIQIKKSAEGAMLKGAAIQFDVNYVLDQYGNPLKVDPSQLKLVDAAGLGTINGHTFTAKNAGQGVITAQYGNATKDFPINIVSSVAKLDVAPKSIQAHRGQKLQLNAKGYDAKSMPVIMNNSSLTWSTTGDIGTISSSGLYTASNTAGAKGSIVAEYGSTKVTIPVEIIGETLLLDGFENSLGWTNSTIRATGSISLAGNGTFYSGKNALKLMYNFESGETGTAAAYLNPKTVITLNGHPTKLGLRVFGDKNQQWLRGKIVDANGESHTIDFTEEKGMTWGGWNYVEAALSKDWPAPLKLEQIYVAQTDEGLKSKGTLYFDDLKAIYVDDHKEPLFRDTPLVYRANTEIGDLVNRGIISGYSNGLFQPNTNLNRVQAAILLSRALNLDIKNVKNPNYKDVPSAYRFYGNIAAVKEAGIMNGKDGGKNFDPYGKLTRAEMAVIIQRAYDLPNATQNYFEDNHKGTFSYNGINALAQSEITLGFKDGTFRPADFITRTDFSVFLYRAIHLK